MENMGVIRKVEQPTEWVSNIVVIDNPNKLRICIDPRPLNEAVKIPHYPIPSADRLMTNLQGSTVFSLFDATNGPEEFQKAVEELFENEPNVIPYFDDIYIGSKTMEEHCKALRSVLNIARKNNLKFNPLKTQLAKSSITYLGHKISGKGIEPDSKKLESIEIFPTPQNKQELQRFLGMVTYLAKFAPILSNMAHSLRQLLKKNSVWLWDSNMERDFELIKKKLLEVPCLQIFYSNKPVILSVDASTYGLGAVLLQNSQPVAYGSVSLTNTQQRYAQIEKELLAVIFGLEHFNYYTYGRNVTVETDHKPLLGLSKKPYDSISPRLQRMLLRLNKYNVNLIYVPGKQLVIADTLSRAQLNYKIFNDDNVYETPADLCLLATASPTRWEELSKLTKDDPELYDVVYHIKNGWPDKINTRKYAKQLWHCKAELYLTKEGLICRGSRLVVPNESRTDILEKIHTSHRGIVSCKIKAKEYFYWPGINNDIDNFISKCDLCQEYQRNNNKECLINPPIPDRPWEKVGCDFFELRGKHYLLIIDYFSKYVALQQMNSTNAFSVINCMKSIFARHGIPEVVISDGGPPFDSFALKEFFEEWGIEHNTSSPYFSRSNGQVERAIQTLKRSLIKADREGKDIYLVLLDYRISPSPDLVSPAELLMGRKSRSMLPCLSKQLKPKYPIKDTLKALKHRQNTQNKYFKSDSSLKPLKVNFWFRKLPKEPWIRDKIVNIGAKPRTYTICAENGKMYDRNRFFIREDKSNKFYENVRTPEDFYSFEEQETVVMPDNNQQNTVMLPNNAQPTSRFGRKLTQPKRYGFE
ncbi:Retrovirus-related Pol polyprotein from transposon 17.6 [Araneus ventricosus]|uniref:RNA-directed DNA polymerase n=1 Tax=Araneus ventricosus TaxID=182803 RepID=A0A4Y2FVB1_ARAVE|nr:Retrovirus-related Pol polyprotein from transposon 17.6 [Araneus ventricosus]